MKKVCKRCYVIYPFNKIECPRCGNNDFYVCDEIKGGKDGN